MYFFWKTACGMVRYCFLYVLLSCPGSSLLFFFYFLSLWYVIRDVISVVLSAGVEVWRWRVLAGRSMVRRGAVVLCWQRLAQGVGHTEGGAAALVRTHLRTATRTVLGGRPASLFLSFCHLRAFARRRPAWHHSSIGGCCCGTVEQIALQIYQLRNQTTY